MRRAAKLLSVAWVLRACASHAGPTTLPAGVTVEQLSAVLFDLGAGDSVRREAARRSLLSLRRENLPLLRDAIVASRPLAPGATSELRDIVTHVFLTGEPYEVSPNKAFLGVQMTFNELIFDEETPVAAPGQPAEAETVKLRTGVVISECVPGFCAYGGLYAGDVVLALPDLGRAALDGKDDLGQTIATAAPGRRVTLRVLRRGKEIDVPLVLDPRPQVADHGTPAFNGWMSERRKLADDYWQAQFAPVVDDGVL